MATMQDASSTPHECTPTLVTYDMRLSAEHRHQLTVDSAITPEVIDERGYRTVRSKHDWTDFDNKLGEKQIRTPGLGFPVYRSGNPTPYAWILRPDRPRMRSAGGGEKPIKYEWPKGTAPCLDVLPSYREELQNPSVPLWFTEGAKKADALASAFNRAIVPVNLNGVWGWRGTNVHGGKVVLPDLEEVAINGRQIVLAFDSDVVRNRLVLLALQRLAYLLNARHAAKILVLALPQSDDTKLGVDDAFAQGWTPEEVTACLIPLADAISVGREKLFRHLETGKTLYLPAGYINSGESIARVDRGEPHIVYPSLIAVEASGVDLQTQTETLTVRFNGRGGKPIEVTAPRAELSRAKGVIEHLAARGASVHESNARDVARYLIEFAHENRDALPHRPHTNRLGLFDGGLVLPAGSVGFDQDQDVRYIGKHTIRVGTDRAAYKWAIAEAFKWDHPWTFLMTLGLSLASPAIARIRPRRNPTAYLAGSSNSGKTTLSQFTVGAWGDPTRAPLRLEAGRTTRAGMMQTLEELAGLPLFIDEAHTTRDPRDLESTVYQFANGEAYTRGGVDGKTKGGEPLGGALILAGEALPEFRHAGAHGRVLWIDVGQFPPLGCEPKSREGARRAELLEHAWLSGAGLLGHEVAQAIWSDWPVFLSNMKQCQTHHAIKGLYAWRDSLAITFTTLDVMIDLLGIEAPPHFAHLLDRWSDMFTASQEQSDPATEAWEQLVTMLAQAEQGIEGEWEVMKLQHQLIACRPSHDPTWRVSTQAQQFKERVGPTATQLYGRTWLQRGWIVPHANGLPTYNKRVAGGMSIRVLLVPHRQLVGDG